MKLFICDRKLYLEQNCFQIGFVYGRNNAKSNTLISKDMTLYVYNVFTVLDMNISRISTTLSHYSMIQLSFVNIRVVRSYSKRVKVRFIEKG